MSLAGVQLATMAEKEKERSVLNTFGPVFFDQVKPRVLTLAAQILSWNDAEMFSMAYARVTVKFETCSMFLKSINLFCTFYSPGYLQSKLLLGC